MKKGQTTHKNRIYLSVSLNWTIGLNGRIQWSAYMNIGQYCGQIQNQTQFWSIVNQAPFLAHSIVFVCFGHFPIWTCDSSLPFHAKPRPFVVFYGWCRENKWKMWLPKIIANLFCEKNKWASFSFTDNMAIQNVCGPIILYTSSYHPH